ncbi:MAG: Flp pilus assembly protein CpaB [Terriglobales bacterium]
MDRRRFVIIGVMALALAGLVSFGVLRVLQPQTGARQETAAVVVAATDLTVGQALADSDLRVVRVPTAQVPKDALMDKKDVIGRGVIIPMQEKELVLNSKLAPREAGAGLPPKIPQGMRAISLRVREDISVAGFTLAGTHVDLLLTGNIDRNNDPTKITTTTVLENVEVLSANQELQSDGTPKKDATVVTLLVSPEDAQKLTLASTQGNIRLSLRNPLDREEVKPPPQEYGPLYLEAGAPKEVMPAVRPVTVRRSRGQMVPVRQAYVVETIRGDKRDETKF